MTVIRELGSVALPEYSGVRVLMMPFRTDDIMTVPPAYRWTVYQLAKLSECPSGVGYLTIDEAHVRAGESHRRPGLHTDGCGGYGGPRPYGSSGMVLLASHHGCVGWDQEPPGVVWAEGEAEHLRPLLDDARRVEMAAGRAYWCAPNALHESIAQPRDVRRQFVRLSFPNDEPWYTCNTPSPYGVLPTGPIAEGREHFVQYRA